MWIRPTTGALRRVILAPALVALTFVCATASARASSTPPWQSPLAGAVRVLRPFVPPPGAYAAGHRGVDLAAPAGTTVYAAGAGTISFAGQVGGTGVVAIDHGDGLRTTYEPVRASVSPGRRVGVGAAIGVVTSMPGHCTVGPCLHWGLRRGELYLDPLGLLQPPTGAVLLPFLDGAVRQPRLDHHRATAAAIRPAGPGVPSGTATVSRATQGAAAGGLAVLAAATPLVARRRHGIARAVGPSRQSSA